MGNVSLVNGHIDENINTYIKDKIRLLADFGIKLTSTQKKHIKSLKSEIAVDNFARDLLKPSHGYDVFSNDNNCKRHDHAYTD